MTEKSGFILLLDQYEPIRHFDLAQKGVLLDAFFAFHRGEAVRIDDPAVMVAFSFFRQSFARNAAKYEERCRKNRENAQKRYAKPAAAYGGCRPPANDADTDADADADADADGRKEDPDGSLPPDGSGVPRPRETAGAAGAAGDGITDCGFPAGGAAVSHGGAAAGAAGGSGRPSRAGRADGAGRAREDGVPPPCPHGKIRALFAEVLPALPQARVWNAERERQLRARWCEVWDQARKTGGGRGEPELLAWWRGFFEHVAKCPWLMGRGVPQPGRQTFVADLVWLTKKENFAKVIDGRYLPRRGS